MISYPLPDSIHSRAKPHFLQAFPKIPNTSFSESFKHHLTETLPQIPMICKYKPNWFKYKCVPSGLQVEGTDT